MGNYAIVECKTNNLIEQFETLEECYEFLDENEMDENEFGIVNNII